MESLHRHPITGVRTRYPEPYTLPYLALLLEQSKTATDIRWVALEAAPLGKEELRIDGKPVIVPGWAAPEPFRAYTGQHNMRALRVALLDPRWRALAAEHIGQDSFCEEEDEGA